MSLLERALAREGLTTCTVVDAVTIGRPQTAAAERWLTTTSAVRLELTARTRASVRTRNLS